MVFAKIIIGDSRKMIELKDSSIDLVVTSPPYWHIKNYGVEGQIGYGQSLHEYLKSLYIVWKECFRVLKPGTRLCINIGDQFLRGIIYGKYKVAPLHSELIVQCEKIGFDYMGSIIWHKKTTMNTTGGANVMGSYPYPPNGLIEIDYEFILIFKKPGKKTPPSKEIKEKSKLTKEEWKEYFSGHWNFPGERQIEHEAMFPEELPKRLIRMFTFVGDTVLDPFLGSGTTVKAALNLERNAIGYEINEKFLPIIKKKIDINQNLFENKKIEITKRNQQIKIEPVTDYIPNIKDAMPQTNPELFKFERERLYTVKEVLSENSIKLDTGLIVKLLGVKITKKDEAKQYLEKFVKGKKVFLKFDPSYQPENNITPAYVFLKNKIFINKEMIKQGFADIQEGNFLYKNNFAKVKTLAEKNG
ncbi:DNA modification methylase [Candidatus Kryptonium thompsonii]|jgi:DNA modification methylase|uniref:Methyltransferase n=2 Tax=Candidatus Kryptonium thompsonii TaxID=1633631 RepID=A0A0P1LJ54_9BACT|nr:DNA modification methylase [Candidatus Kryptonium thompsoni]CUS86069.1 DNA modification methylase [Candidatus Kryptonium thompsoni]CUS90262.1 DNA modification methylase [Candidatus Kryptonium thompsoni]CUS91743.1 DNA modification methylase [Candidatus Kryptonium thompsoni]CUS92666.1 DNA modification methylase [Candidatus Kryptonium thompsoni]